MLPLVLECADTFMVEENFVNVIKKAATLFCRIDANIPKLNRIRKKDSKKYDLLMCVCVSFFQH